MKKSPLLVAPLLAAALSSPTVLAEMSEAELEAELEAVASRLGEGYSPSGKTMTGGLAEGQTKRWTRSLEAGTCYRFVAVGGELVEDLDLKVYSGADLVASDGGAVSTPVAHYCTDADTSVEMRLQMYEGQGQFAIGLYARGGPSEDAPLEASEGERAMLAKLAETAGRIAPGTDPVAAPVAGTLAYRNAHSIEVPLSESSCYKFLAVGGAGVTDMILGVSVDGVEVASDRISGRNPVAQWCAPRSAKATVKLTMYAGGGPFALGAYRTRAAAAEAPEKVGGSESDFVANRLRQLHAQFGKARAAISPVFRGNLSTNDEQVFDVRLSAGHCYTIVAAGSPSVRDLDLSILDGGGRELQADRTRRGFVHMDTDPCPAFTGKHILKVKMAAGFGQFGVQVFSD